MLSEMLVLSSLSKLRHIHSGLFLECINNVSCTGHFGTPRAKFLCVE